MKIRFRIKHEQDQHDLIVSIRCTPAEAEFLLEDLDRIEAPVSKPISELYQLFLIISGRKDFVYENKTQT